MFLLVSAVRSAHSENYGNLWEPFYIVYVIESAAYGVLFTSRLCQKPERARNERVRVFDTNNELFITHKTRIFIKIVF